MFSEMHEPLRSLIGNMAQEKKTKLLADFSAITDPDSVHRHKVINEIPDGMPLRYDPTLQNIDSEACGIPSIGMISIFQEFCDRFPSSITL
jgi:hypothetical protein